MCRAAPRSRRGAAPRAQAARADQPRAQVVRGLIEYWRRDPGLPLVLLVVTRSPSGGPAALLERWELRYAAARGGGGGGGGEAEALASVRALWRRLVVLLRTVSCAARTRRRARSGARPSPGARSRARTPARLAATPSRRRCRARGSRGAPRSTRGARAAAPAPRRSASPSRRAKLAAADGSCSTGPGSGWNPNLDVSIFAWFWRDRLAPWRRRRGKFARPNVSRNDVDLTELESFKLVGNPESPSSPPNHRWNPTQVRRAGLRLGAAAALRGRRRGAGARARGVLLRRAVGDRPLRARARGVRAAAAAAARPHIGPRRHSAARPPVGALASPRARAAQRRRRRRQRHGPQRRAPRGSRRVVEQPRRARAARAPRARPAPRRAARAAVL